MRATLGVQIAHAMPTSYLIVWYSKELFTAWLKVNECMEEAISASCLRTPYCSRRICPGIRSKQIIYEGYQAAYIAKSCFQGNPWTRQHIWNPGRTSDGPWTAVCSWTPVHFTQAKKRAKSWPWFAWAGYWSQLQSQQNAQIPGNVTENWKQSPATNQICWE